MNFHTECWYLTLQAHHLSVMPCIRRYQRRLRALRDLKKAIEELEESEKDWNVPNNVHRLKQAAALKKYKSQLKVTTTAARERD